MLLLAVQHVLSTVPTRSLVSSAHAPVASPPLETLMLFGFLVALPTLFWKVYGPRTAVHHACAALCFAGIAAYAFLQGAWPVGLVELVSSAVALGPLWRKLPRHLAAGRSSRISRVFDQGEFPRGYPATPPYLGGGDPMAVCNN